MKQLTNCSRLTGHIYAGATVLIWGSTFIFSKLLLACYTPVQIMMMRFVIGYLFLWLLRPRWVPLKLKQEFRFFILGFLGCTVYFWAENTALTYTLAANVSIIIALAPILASILAHFFTKDEKLHPAIWVGFVVAMAGVSLVVFNGTVALELNPLGDLLSLFAAATWAVHSILLKKYAGDMDSIVLARKINFYGMLSAIPMLFGKGESGFSLLPLREPEMLFSLLFLSILGTAFCYVTWNIVIVRLGVVTSNNYLYLQPFITMLAAYLILDEEITLMGFAGAVLIVGGVIFASRPPKKKVLETASCQNPQKGIE